MSKARPVPAIAFANEHINSDISTFDAASSIQRLELLLDDAADAQEILEPILSKRWYPAFFEFVAFYQVGFVTCLEWHAKSRLFDLFVFNPKAITTSDIRQGLSDAKIMQMVFERLTVPHLIVSSFNISSFDKYVLILERVLKGLGSSISMSDLIAPAENSTSSLGQTLASLYEERNSLVHEISLQDIGHRNIRDYCDFDEILATGKTVLELIKAVEQEITNNAPPNFPNLLDIDGVPVSSANRISNEISVIEEAIVKESKLEESSGEFTEGEWIDAVINSKQYLNSELEFINSLNLAGAQYYDVRPKLEAKLLEQRLTYLQMLKREIAPADDE